jgi:hypothetical protein
MEKIEYTKGLTSKALIVAIIIAAIMIPIAITSVSYNLGGIGQTRSGEGLLFWAFWPLLAGAILTSVGKKFRLSPSELAVIYTIIMIMGTVPNLTGRAVMPSVVGARGFGAARQWYIDNMSPLWGPLDQATLDVLWTGGALDWGAWTIPIMWWILFFISGHMFLLFWTAILRKQFIEVESVPYPWATPYTELVNMATTKNEEKGAARFFKNWLFIIPVIIAFIWSFIAGYLTWWFDFSLPTGVGSTGFLIYNFTPNAYITGIVWLQFDFTLTSFGYILPTDVLLTVVSTTILLCMVVPELLAQAGVIAPLPAGQPIQYSTNFITHLGFNNVDLAWGYMGMFWGILFTIAAYPIIVHRQLLIKSFKTLLGTEKEDVDSNEPMGYRSLWIGMIVFLIVWIIAIVISGAGIEYSLLTALTMILFQTGYSRFWGETGIRGSPNQTAFGFGYYQTYIIPQAGNPQGAFATLTANDTFFYKNADPYGRTVTFGMESYKIGELLKTKSKDIFFAQIIGISIAIVAGLIGTFLWLQNVGMLLGASWFGTPWGQPGISAHGNPRGLIFQERWYPVVPNYFTLGMFIFGIALTIGMYWLRGRYPRFLFTPAAILIPFFWVNGPSYWFSLLISLIVKWIVLRVGGRKYYDIGMKVVIGLLLGFGLGLGFTLVLKESYFILGFPKPAHL